MEDVKGSDQPNNQSVVQQNQMDINDAFDKIAIESFEAAPSQLAVAAPPAATSEKQKGHKYLSKKKQEKRK